jgi:hypothetical protein
MALRAEDEPIVPLFPCVSISYFFVPLVCLVVKAHAELFLAQTNML